MASSSAASACIAAAARGGLRNAGRQQQQRSLAGTRVLAPGNPFSSWRYGNWSSASSSNDDDDWRRRSRRRQQLVSHRQRRDFRATPKREIVPLVGAAALFVLVRYSFKALRRMDDEWEEYQWQLSQYEKRQAADENRSDDASFVIAVDIGSLYTKLASKGPPKSSASSSSSSPPSSKAEVVVTREGDRSFFNGVVLGGQDGDDRAAVRGRAALDRFYYNPKLSSGEDAAGTVTLPCRADTVEQLSRVLRGSLTPALREALDRIDFGADKSPPEIRTVITHPVDSFHSRLYADAFSDPDSGILPSIEEKSSQQQLPPPVLLPEAVAAIWGAEGQGLLPTDEDPSVSKTKVYLVVDIGAMTTQFSIVQRDLVLCASTVAWGGEQLVRRAVELLLRESPTELTDDRSLSSIQVQARSAVFELSTQSRVSVHVPYLFPDPKGHHLDTTLSRTVLEQAVHTEIAREYGSSNDDDPGDNPLSPHMPPPTNLTSLWTSVLTHTLEQSGHIPMNINHVLLVGGGTKAPFVSKSLKDALEFLGFQSHVVVAPGSGQRGDTTSVSETTVIGATLVPPAYGYSPEHGLYRLN